LGYQWKLSDSSDFKTNIGSAFRTPNVAELFSFGQQGFRSIFGLLRFTDTNGLLSTDEVTPLDESEVDLERGYKLTTEFRTAKNGNSHLITGYANYIDNYVFDRPIGVFGTIRGPQAAFIVDQAEALFLGVDYSWKRELTQQLSASYGVSYLWARNIGEDEALIDQPPITTNLQLDWDQGKWWVFDSSSWSLRPSYTFRQFQAPRTVSPESLADGSAVVTPDSEIFDFLDAPEGYLLFDLSWNFKWKSFRGSVTAQNLLNTSYRSYLNELRYFADEPGRNILFALNYNL
jgi:iron complex outermembrane receptor protein